MLADHHIGAAPVVDAGKLVGLLRDEDLIVSEAKLHVPDRDRVPRRRARVAEVREALGSGAQEGGRVDRCRCDDYRLPDRLARRQRRSGRDRDARPQRQPRLRDRRSIGSSASSPAAISSATWRPPHEHRPMTAIGVAQAHRDRGRRHRGRRRCGLRRPTCARDPPASPRRSRQPTTPLVPAFDEAIRIDCHDAGSLYVITRGDGPPILFAHGVTLSSAHVGRSSSTPSPPPASAPSRSTVAATASPPSARPVTRSTTSRKTCGASSNDSTCAARCSSVIRWAGWRSRRSPSGTPTSREARVAGIVLMSTAARAVTSDARRLRGTGSSA